MPKKTSIKDLSSLAGTSQELRGIANDSEVWDSFLQPKACKLILMVGEDTSIHVVDDRGIIFLKKIHEELKHITVYWFEGDKMIEKNFDKVALSKDFFEK